MFPLERVLTRCMGLLLPNRCHNPRAINLVRAKTSTRAKPYCPLCGASAVTRLNSSSSYTHTSRWCPWPWTWVIMMCPNPGLRHVLFSLIIFTYPLPSSSGHRSLELHNLRAWRSTRGFYIPYPSSSQGRKLAAKAAAGLPRVTLLACPSFY